MDTAADETLALKNQFYIGAYQQVLNEAANPATTPKAALAKTDRRVLLNRAYIAQGRHALVLSDIADSEPLPELRAVRLLARFSAHGASPADRDAVAAEATALADSLLHADPLATNPLALVVLATIFASLARYDDALRLLVRAPKHLECIALAVQIYLKLDRIDLARKEIKAFKAWADDATLAQLIESWVNLVTGGNDKYQEAYYVFEELANTATITSKLLTGKAVSKIQSRQFAEPTRSSWTPLTSLTSPSCLARSQNPNDPDTLANLVVAATALQKPVHAIDQYISQLRIVSPGHPLLHDLALKDSLFDRSAQRFAAA
ncbi:coatomer epsilon subunit-domain-containing protein [Entophlyctis helioformis]|nr:coatomer epsilon subunit-domain-containing protein [Entophlyctis helioformis]